MIGQVVSDGDEIAYVNRLNEIPATSGEKGIRSTLENKNVANVSGE